MDALRELDQLEDLIEALRPYGRVEVLARIPVGVRSYPIYGIVLGGENRRAPTYALVGGVHGLERIGTQVVLAYMTMLARLLEWDELLRSALRDTRIVCVPLVNPGGMVLRRRSNPRGVDLMRNAPPHPRGSASFFVGGQSISPRLPWFRGREDDRMEVESSVLCDFIRREVFAARASILVDVHSGFGLQDRLWFPYARTRKPFPHLAEVYALGGLLDRTLPHHVYRLEPQSDVYTIQGDVWDYMYDEHRRSHPGSMFLPLTLEMGSWLWLKKNPRQIFDVLGSFNPMKPHRLRRTLRRHLSLLDLFRRAAAAPFAWSGFGPERRRELEERAFERWYSG